MTIVEELLDRYAFSEIVIFLFFIALAFKELFTIWEWFKTKLRGYFKKEELPEQEKQQVLDEIQNLSCMIQNSINNQEQLSEDIKQINDIVNTLVESDKDDIKAWITREHHYFCYQKGFIDDFSLDCIEKRYKHYVKEGGNSYIATLMQEIRKLPKVSKPECKENKKEIARERVDRSR